MMKYLIAGLVVVLSACIQESLACNGYGIRIKKLESCKPDSIIQFEPGYKLELNDKCEIISKVCVKTKGFASAKGSVLAKKGIMQLFEGKKDMCKEAENPYVQQLAKVLGLDKVSHCPVKEGTYCSDENHPIALGKAGIMIGAGIGTYSLHSDIIHDIGVSCINAEFEILKK